MEAAPPALPAAGNDAEVDDATERSPQSKSVANVEAWSEKLVNINAVLEERLDAAAQLTEAALWGGTMAITHLVRALDAGVGDTMARRTAIAALGAAAFAEEQCCVGQEAVHVAVHDVNGQVQCDPKFGATWKTEEIKAFIAQLISVSPEHQKLFFRGRELDDGDRPFLRLSAGTHANMLLETHGESWRASFPQGMDEPSENETMIAEVAVSRHVVGDEDVLRALLACVTTDPDRVTRLLAVRALGQMTDGTSAETYYNILRTLADLVKDEDEDELVATAAAEVLCQTATKDSKLALDVFVGVAQDEGLASGPRAAAANAIRRLAPRGHEESISALIVLLASDSGDNSNATGRSAAAAALGDVAQPGDEMVIEALVTSMVDEEPEVRRAAAVGLASVATGDGRLRSLLLHLIDDEASEVRQAVVAQLPRTVEPRGSDEVVAKALAQCMKDPDGRVRQVAATSLALVANVGDKRALKAMAGGMHDTDFGARCATRDAIKALAMDPGDLSRLATLRHGR